MNVLLIGALGGLGSKTIELLSSEGYHIYVTDIHTKVLDVYASDPNVIPFVMDICKEDSIKEVKNQIATQIEGLDAIIHMAGILEIGSLAEIAIEKLQNAMEINLYGIYRVNLIFLPLILKNKGRILTISSEVGRQTAAPFNGIYSITKHALEAYSDALRRELNFLGIKVIKIQPGPFKTNMTKNAEQKFIEAKENSIYFKENLEKGIVYLPKVYENAHEPIILAKKIVNVIQTKNPKTAYSVKADIPRIILDKFPVKWADALIKKMLS